MKSVSYTVTESPVGDLLLAADGEGLRRLVFQGGKRPLTPPASWRRDKHARVLLDAASQLKAYFAGDLREFDLPLAPEGTAFQLRVWKGLQDIPWGETRSYGELAASIGSPNASRAVGAANGKNPLAIVIPCHRVIGSTGKLTGFGGGLHVKANLLKLERQPSGIREEAPSFL